MPTSARAAGHPPTPAPIIGDRADQAFAVLRPERPEPRPLRDLAARLGASLTGEIAGLAVSGVTLRTQEVRAGDLFVGVPGARQHGAEHAAPAREAGAVALLTDCEGAERAAGSGLPVLVVDDPRAVLGDAAAWVHRTAEQPMELLAVTGTNGKTTTVTMLGALLELLGRVPGTSTTAERRIGDERVPSRLTTPEACELHALLARMRERGVDIAAVEVSAQALARHRVDGIRFDVAGFTNLSRDHLDDFGEMDEYFAAKRRLFAPERCRTAVVSLDSPHGRWLAADCPVPVVTIAADPALPADWRVSVTETTPDGTAFELADGGGRRIEARIPLIGAHAAADAALAIVMLVEAGHDLDRIAAVTAGRLIPVAVPGRLDRLPNAHGPAVYLDIAHSPDAFAKALTAVRAVTRGRVLMVFGADGDRDRGKRAAMGRVAAEGADVLLVTDHHMRFEDPGRIRAALVAGARSAGRPVALHEVPDPHRAIRLAVGWAGEDDAVLWTGSGRTEFHEVRGTLQPFSFRGEALAALTAAGWECDAST